MSRLKLLHCNLVHEILQTNDDETETFLLEKMKKSFQLNIRWQKSHGEGEADHRDTKDLVQIYRLELKTVKFRSAAGHQESTEERTTAL